jgi:hypothetical protein
MAGLEPAIHDFMSPTVIKTWMAGPNPAMTVSEHRRYRVPVVWRS